MTTYQIRFNLAPAMGGSMQNPARCVAIEAATPDDALAKLINRYPERAPRPYLIEVDGVWRKIEWASQIETLAVHGKGALTSTVPMVGRSVRRAPVPMTAETPEWAAI